MAGIVRIITPAGEFLINKDEVELLETDVGSALTAPRYFSVTSARWVHKPGTFFTDNAEAIENYDSIEELAHG